MGALWLALATHATASAAPGANVDTPVVREVYLMGTRARLVAWSTDRATGLLQLESFVRVLEETEHELTTWRDDGPLGRLNLTPAGQVTSLPASLCRTLTAAGRWEVETGGAFDPAIRALVEAWGLRAGGRIPSAAELRTARQRSGWTLLGFDERTCTAAPIGGVGIDSGGFGKGDALDRLRALPAATQPAQWLADLGGQVAVGGAGGGSWRIAIADPGARDRAAREVTLKSGSLSTSGGSERDLVAEGRRVGHILDPRTGYPATFRGSVTVWHESALAADALSTGLYVLGPAEGIRWANERSLAACYLERASHGSLRATPTRAFSEMFPGACERGTGRVTLPTNGPR